MREAVVKAVIVAILAILLAALGASAAWFRARLPPDCADPRTVALVHQSLITRYHLPPATTLDHIRTIAGGWLAFRFVCRADLAGFARDDIPPGMPVPDHVRYTSQLTADRSRHEVSVIVVPLLIWEPAE